jgi:alpha-methylacyl-CoA racemase
VLGLDEITSHEHIRARGTFIEEDGIWQPAPAPRFSGTPAPRPEQAVVSGADTEAVMRELGYADEGIAALRDAGAMV